ncbi:MAG: DNA recombination protein RmuC [Elusimicrobiota bacterium]
MTTAAVILAVLAGAVLGALGVYAILFSVRKNAEAESRQQREELKGQFASVSADIFTNATDQFLKLAESRLATERVKAEAGLEEKQKAVETVVGQLQERLQRYEKMMRDFEAERSEKYGSLEEQLKSAARTTQDLQLSTDKLGAVLSNSRSRGQWGERMAEDILRAAGLIEDVQYVKNRAQATVSTRPDFTFNLPDDHKINMDVKFPLDNYLRMDNAESDEDKARYKADFLKDVKARVKEIQNRSYINPEEQTLDYVILFIPNEQVYGFVLENLPGYVDEALAQKVVLCSPFSLYAVLAVVRQSFENFHFSKATREMVKFVGSFRQAYEKFKVRFVKLGEQIDKTRGAYEEITGPSYKMLDQAVARIESAQQESGEEAPPEVRTP